MHNNVEKKLNFLQIYFSTSFVMLYILWIIECISTVLGEIREKSKIAFCAK